MDTVVLSALEVLGAQAVTETLDRLLHERGETVRRVELSEIDHGPCLACSGCSETGRCVLKDDMTDVVEEIMHCRRVVLATPIFLGVHHPLMKKAVDRFLPLAGELFTMRGGEMHHRTRLMKPFSLLGVGWLEEDAPREAEDTFARLIGRHALNMACPRRAAVLLRQGVDVEAPLRLALEETEERR